MSRFDNLEATRASVDPGDVVVAGEKVYRFVSWEGDEFRADRVALEDHVEWLPWTAIEAYHHRDDADVDALLEELGDIVPDAGEPDWTVQQTIDHLTKEGEEPDVIAGDVDGDDLADQAEHDDVQQDVDEEQGEI